jgi:hypothetical protein
MAGSFIDDLFIEIKVHVRFTLRNLSDFRITLRTHWAFEVAIRGWLNPQTDWKRNPLNPFLSISHKNPG